MKKKLIIAFSILVIVILGGSVYLSNVLAAGKDLAINPITLTDVKDGTYTGTYDGGLWTNKVNVTVVDGKITQIDVLDGVFWEKPDITNALIKNVIAGQNNDVDVVSEATVTSKAYLKSIENALAQ